MAVRGSTFWAPQAIRSIRPARSLGAASMATCEVSTIALGVCPDASANRAKPAGKFKVLETMAIGIRAGR